eukprot:GHVS01020644.1.p1 GENE.GHVS01020644.1~~GHVS01020644.1.p1  ORF type:complete len:102 (-),score=10.57 GHVS01020644.1:265-570(-)
MHICNHTNTYINSYVHKFICTHTHVHNRRYICAAAHCEAVVVKSLVEEEEEKEEIILLSPKTNEKKKKSISEYESQKNQNIGDNFLSPKKFTSKRDYLRQT